EHCQSTHSVLVLDQQDRFRPPRIRAAVNSSGRGKLLVHGWEVDLEHGANLRLAVDFDMPSALPDDAEDDRQAQAGPLAAPLRREERLKDLGRYVRRHSTAGVGD